MAYRDVVLVDTPLDYYEMETSTGTDSGSGSRTLTLNGPTTDVAGAVGDGWSFDGTNDYATMATFPSLTTAFTFEAWVKPNVAGVNDTPTIIRINGTDIALVRVRGSSTSNPGQAEVYIDGTTLLSGANIRVDDNQWHHIVYTQSGNAAKLYVDRVERATATTSQSTFNFGTSTGYIGQSGSSGEYFKGIIDEVAVYNTALSPTRIAAHFAAVKPYKSEVLADSPVDYYEMETSVGTDSGSGGRALTLVGGITTDVATGGKLGDSWTFDGADGNCGTMATFPAFTAGVGFTLEAWIKPNFAGLTTSPNIMAKNGTDSVRFYMKGSAAANPGQVVCVHDGTTCLADAAYRIDDDKWHHVAYTQVGTAGKLYIDGVERQSVTTTSTYAFGTSTGGRIGEDSSGAGAAWKGSMAHVAIYATGLSGARITAHYDAGANVTYIAEAMTASGTAPNGVGTGNATITTVNPSFDTSSNGDSSTSLVVTDTDPAIFEFTRTGISAGDIDISSAILWVKVTSVHTGTTAESWRATSGYAKAGSATDSESVNVATDTWVSFNVTSAIQYAFDNTEAVARVGLWLTGSGQTNFYSIETASNDPYLIVTYLVAPIVAAPMTATGEMPTATVVLTTSASYSASPMTASGEAPSVTVDAVGNASYTASALAATGELPTAVVTTEQTITYDSAPMTGSAEAPTATVTTQQTITHVASVMTASSEMPTVTITVEQSLEYAASPMTASETMPNVTVVTEISPTFVADPITATVEMPNTTVSTGSDISITVDVMAGSGEMPTETVEVISNPEYVATPITASATMPDATAVIVNDAEYVASAMTATGDTPTALPRLSISRLPTDDYYYKHSDGVITDITTVYGDTNYSTVMRFDDVPAGQVIDASTLSLRPQQFDSGNITLYPILSSFASRPVAKASFTLGTGIVLTFDGTTNLQAFDISSLLAQGNIYGFFLEHQSAAFFSLASMSNATSGFRPLLAMTYHSEQVAVSPVADAMTASGEMPDATVSLVTDINTVAEPFTGNAAMPEAIGIADRDVEIVVESIDAEAEMPDGVFSLPVTVAAEPFTAETESPEATATVTIVISVVAGTTPMKGAARFVYIAQVNDTIIEGEAVNDNYYNRVNAKQPSYWVRMLSPTSPMNNFVTGQPVVDVRGIILLAQLDGPDARPSINFTGGGYLEQREPSGTNQDENVPYLGTNWAGDLPHTLEFSFRTTKSTQFILAGSDSLVALNTGVVSDANVASEINLVSGKLQFKHYRTYTPTGTRDLATDETVIGTGNRLLNDNEWHHIVIKHAKSPVRDEWGFEIWVDGVLEMRRLLNEGWAAGFPDYIGGRPSYMSGVTLPILPNSRHFEGDMGEIIFYPMLNLTQEEIERNHYAFMGWVPVEAQPMEADATSVDANGRGNQKRALYLYWNSRDEVFQPDTVESEAISFDPMPGFVEQAFSSNVPWTNAERVGDYHGFKVFSRGVKINTNNEAYRDAFTDEQSLINLLTDVDIEDYDIIMFKDWPDESEETDLYEWNYPGQKERLLNQLREVNDLGVGLFVTNPRLAVDLGIVDDLEFVPSLIEHKYNNAQGSALGLYDYGSAVKFPWNIQASDGLTGGQFAAGIGVEQDVNLSYLDNKAYYYHDTNANNRFRVRAVIEGLTDLPSYMLEEAVWHVDADAWGWQGVAYKYLERDNGLLIGDEYIFYGSQEIDPRWLSITERRYNRFNGTWATPPGAVKAGTVVTTFGAKHWLSKVEVDNPYKDYVTTIVLEQGDTLNGRSVGGRIFVNFSEQPSYGLGFIVQDIPEGSVGWPLSYQEETDAQREWGYSWTRTTLRSSAESSVNSIVNIVLPDGTIQAIRVGGSSETLTMVRSNQLFPLSGQPRMEMAGRGIYWLGAVEEEVPGSITTQAAPMTAILEAYHPVVTAQRDGGFATQPMVAIAMMPKVDEDETGEVEITTLPMYAEVTFTNYGKVVAVAPITATAELVENFDFVHTTGEQVALVLHNFPATLYLKEEA